MSTSEPSEREFVEGEDLVAYLDGELPPEDSRRIEERLANDDDYVQQLRQLDQAWEALDTLPRTVADDDFARTTIEMVAQKAQLDLTERVAEVAQVERRNHFRWIAAAALFAAASFAIAGMLLPNPDQRLLDNLPVIRQSHLLVEISDIDFLRALANDVDINQLIRDKEAYEREFKAIEAASAPLEARKQWVQGLNPEQQQSLYAQENRYFNDYSDETRKRLTTLHDTISAQSDSEALEKALVAYGQWLVGKGENLKAQLRDPTLESDYRIGRIEEESRRIAGIGARNPSEAERGRLRDEIRAIANEYQDAVLGFSQNQPPPPGFDERVWEERRAKVIKFLDAGGVPAELLIVNWALLNPETAEQTRERLVKQLGDPAREYLEFREGDDRRGGPRGGGRGSNILGRWVSETLSVARGPVGTEELIRFFAHDLTPAQRQRLLEYPSSEFEAEVRNVLVEQENGVRELSQLMGLDQGRGGGRGGPRGGRGGGFGGQGPPGGGGGPPGPPPGGPFNRPPGPPFPDQNRDEK